MKTDTNANAVSASRAPVDAHRCSLPSAKMLIATVIALLALVSACSSPPGGDGVGEGGRGPSDSLAARALHSLGDTTARRSDVGGHESAAGRVTLTPAGLATARIVVEAVGAGGASVAGSVLEVPGQVEFDPARVALISPRTAGRIERLTVVVGDRVRAGQIVALLQSPSFLTNQTDLLQAKRRSELLAGTPDADGARALLDAARRRLALMGVSADAVARLEVGSTPSALLPVAAPFAGSIIEAPVLTGAAVEAGTPLFKLADLSVVNVAAQVPERALAAVRMGQRATIRVAAYPGLRVMGSVARIGDQVDSAQRTVEALVRVSNARRALKPGMFATVALDLPSVRTTSTADAPGQAGPFSVPESAVVTDGEARYVFVQVAPLVFERRTIELAPRVSATSEDGHVSVVGGLASGDRVVVRGAFTLKSELAKATFAEDEE